MKAIETLFQKLPNKKPSPELFRCSVVQELKAMGVKDPSISLKSGGSVGTEAIESIVERFRLSTKLKARCPATTSVIGSIASQEVVKGITHMYSPVSQFMMFESLDSIPESTYTRNEEEDDLGDDPMESIYGKDIVNELKGMRVFVVGSGAIGCELLKNFALMGLGEGRNVTFNESVGLWQEVGLTGGGVLVTDMDNIERSNLNRQLLFR